MDDSRAGRDDAPAAPIRHRRRRDPVAAEPGRAPPCILALGLSGLLFTPTVGPAALVLCPVAAIWGQIHTTRERRAGLSPSNMAILGRNLGLLVAVPVLFLLAATGLTLLVFYVLVP